MSQQAIANFVIDSLDFVRNSRVIREKIIVAELSRLTDVLYASDDILDYQLSGAKGSKGEPALCLSVRGALRLKCQRCLGALDFPLHIDSLLVLVEGESDMETSDITDDSMDVIVASKTMRVAALIEDEILLALPISPRHEICDTGYQQGNVVKLNSFANLRRQ